MESIQIRRGMDAHVHVRGGRMLEAVVPHSARAFDYLVLMPNTRPSPIATVPEALAYADEVEVVGHLPGRESFKAISTLQLLKSTTVSDIEAMAASRRAGRIVGGVKVYFLGATHNSDNGIVDIFDKTDVLEAMQEHRVPLLGHWEQVTEPEHQKREHAALPLFERVVTRFPRLPISFEHISSKAAIDLVASMPDRVVATITAHHPILTWADVDDGCGHFDPHCLCMPVVKTAEDRDAVLAAMLSGNPKFFFGSDSAPHPVDQKEDPARTWPKDPPNFGVYSADVALPLLCELFEKHGGKNWRTLLENFTAVFGPRFYELLVSNHFVRIEKRPWRVPERYELVKSFLAGRELAWRIAS